METLVNTSDVHKLTERPIWKSRNTNPIRDGYCVVPNYQPEECRDALDSAKLEVSEIIGRSRNNVLLAAILLGLRQIAPQSATKFEEALKQHGHEVVAAIGSASLVALFCFGSLFCDDIRRAPSRIRITRQQITRRAKDMEA